MPSTEGSRRRRRRELRQRSYTELRNSRPELFAEPEGSPIRLAGTAREQALAAAAQRLWMRSAGLPADYGDVGVLYQDQYLLLVRDAVIFPDGRLGSYIRTVPTAATGGAVVLPVFAGRLLLLRHFRHATRTWVWEVPRGFAEPGEEPAATAERELSEELGLAAQGLQRLGVIHPDAGISSAALTVFWTSVTGRPRPEASEGIDRARWLTPTELERWIAAGRVTDAATLSAYALARASGVFG